MSGRKRRKAPSEEEELYMRAASAAEYTGLMYAPPGDGYERRSYSEIQPMMGTTTAYDPRGDELSPDDMRDL